MKTCRMHVCSGSFVSLQQFRIFSVVAFDIMYFLESTQTFRNSMMFTSLELT